MSSFSSRVHVKSASVVLYFEVEMRCVEPDGDLHVLALAWRDMLVSDSCKIRKITMLLSSANRVSVPRNLTVQ